MISRVIHASKGMVSEGTVHTIVKILSINIKEKASWVPTPAGPGSILCILLGMFCSHYGQ